jgi:outer membrane protein TolC
MSRARVLAAAVALGAVLLARPSAAQERPLALDDAMRIALARSPALAERAIDVRIANARVLEAKGLDDFVVGGQAGWQRARERGVLGQPDSRLGNDLVDVAATLDRPLSTGGRVGLRAGGQYTRLADLSAVPRPAAAELYTPSLQLTFAQPLLRGRGYDVARAPQRRAAVQNEASRQELEGAATILLRDVAGAYWELVFSTEELAVRREALTAARDQLAAVNANIEVGKQPATAAAEVEVAIGLRQDEAIDAEAAVTARAAELRRVLGLDPREPAPALRASAPASSELALGPDLVPRALAHNPLLAAARTQVRASAIEIDVAQNGLLPVLDAFVAGGPAGAAPEPGAALRDLGGLRGYAVQAGLTFQEPIQLRGQRGARDAAVALADRARTYVRELETLVARDVTSAVAALEAARGRTTALERAVSLAELDLEGERARFAVSRSTNFDVLRRQQNLALARLSLARARADGAQAVAALEALTGEILTRHGLALASPGGGAR